MIDFRVHIYAKWQTTRKSANKKKISIKFKKQNKKKRYKITIIQNEINK